MHENNSSSSERLTIWVQFTRSRGLRNGRSASRRIKRGRNVRQNESLDLIAKLSCVAEMRVCRSRAAIIQVGLSGAAKKEQPGEPAVQVEPVLDARFRGELMSRRNGPPQTMA